MAAVSEPLHEALLVMQKLALLGVEPLGNEPMWMWLALFIWLLSSSS